MSHCEDHQKLSEVVIRMEEKLDHAIKDTRRHIEAGSKWRLTIVLASISLIGMAVGGIVKFAVLDYKSTLHDNQISKMGDQIYDLNYIRGREEGLVEGRNERLPEVQQRHGNSAR